MEKLLELFKDSLNIFLKKETKNILMDVSEPNLCGRLSIYMEGLLANYGLNGYYADTEYNRKQEGQVKTILDEEMNIIKIKCDLILHSRGDNIKQDNLIAIEMKKNIRPEHEKISDRKRLRAMTKKSYDDIWSYDGKTHPEHVCGYILGIYIILDKNDKKCYLEYYELGNKFEEYTISF